MEERLPLHTIVEKRFAEGIFRGRIVDYTHDRFYRIRYSDGDTEDVTPAQAQTMLVVMPHANNKDYEKSPKRRRQS